MRAYIFGFNSQRDGILRLKNWGASLYLWFQFPTGWNSTQLSRCVRFLFERVSIPNGMEFYCESPEKKALLRAFQFPTGWNSTFCSSSPAPDLRFQFPTGWNSTKLLVWQRDNENCFNSQRDGILPCIKSPSMPLELFQFPTGWNSTRVCPWGAAPIFVSIPNGMEFYRGGRGYLHPRTLFQFPTGWNSTFCRRYSGSQGRVSIPNGMEFYRPC